MPTSESNRYSIQEKDLKYKILIVEVLVFVLPFLCVTYIFYRNHLVLDGTQVMIVSLALLLVLSGVMILRQIFSGIFKISTWVKDAEVGDHLMEIEKDSAELHDITIGFNNLMEKFEDTTHELQARIFELFAIKELTEMASKTLDIKGLLSLLLEKSMLVTKAQIGSVFVLDAERQMFRVIASKGLVFNSEKERFIKMNESLARLVLSKKQPVVVENIETDPRTRQSNNPKYGHPSFLSMPIFAQNNLIAVLNVAKKETNQAFDSNDQHIVSIMIGEIGFALENAQLHSHLAENLRKLQQRTRKLTRVNQQLQKEIEGRKKMEAALTVERNKLKAALAKVKTLSGFLPICASCKKIRDDKGYWNQIEAYIRDHSEAEFSHSICPECKQRLYGQLKSGTGG